MTLTKWLTVLAKSHLSENADWILVVLLAAAVTAVIL